MKPIAEGMGLTWGSQYNRIQQHPILQASIFIMKTVAEDGRDRDMLALPLRLLNGWLFGIEVERVRRICAKPS